LNSYQTHTDRLIGGGTLPIDLIDPNSSLSGLVIPPLADNLGPVISCLRVTQSVGGGLDPSNPCNALNNIFGSILGTGAQLVDLLTKALAGLVALVIKEAADAILAVIGDELAALAAILSELTSFASSSSLVNLSLDPCAQALYNSAGTPALLGALPNIPDF